MRVLLIGGTGIISTDITLLAAQRPDIDLYLLNRGHLPQFVPAGVKCIQADINDEARVKAGIGGLHFDAVADFISYDPEALRRKVELFRGVCGQYLFISSCAAYCYPPSFRLITEENTPTGNPLWSYGLNKSRCEEWLVEENARGGPDYTIVRPAYTYNDIRILSPYSINHWQSWTLAKRLLHGQAYVLPDDGQQLCTAMHTTDFARAFVGLWGNPAARNQAFHLTSSEYLTWKRVAELTAAALEVTPKFCFVPAEKLFLEFGGGAAGEKIMATVRHAAYDNAKLRAAVPGFDCAVRFADGVRRTLQFYRDHPEYQQVDAEWDRNFDRIAAKYGCPA